MHELELLVSDCSGELPLHSKEWSKVIIFKNKSSQELSSIKMYYKANKDMEISIMNEAITYLHKRSQILEDLRNKLGLISWNGPLLVLMVDSIPYIIIQEKEAFAILFID